MGKLLAVLASVIGLFLIASGGAFGIVGGALLLLAGLVALFGIFGGVVALVLTFAIVAGGA